MAKVVIQNVDGLNGEHDFDASRVLTGSEAHLLKEISGVRLGELKEAMRKGDYDLLVAFAVIALLRLGKLQPNEAAEATEQLLAAPVASVDFKKDPDARPPDRQTNVESGGSNGSSSSSSHDSKSVGDPQEKTPAPIGDPG